MQHIWISKYNRMLTLSCRCFILFWRTLKNRRGTAQTYQYTALQPQLWTALDLLTNTFFCMKVRAEFNELQYVAHEIQAWKCTLVLKLFNLIHHPTCSLTTTEANHSDSNFLWSEEKHCSNVIFQVAHTLTRWKNRPNTEDYKWLSLLQIILSNKKKVEALYTHTWFTFLYIWANFHTLLQSMLIILRTLSQIMGSKISI